MSRCFCVFILFAVIGLILWSHFATQGAVAFEHPRDSHQQSAPVSTSTSTSSVRLSPHVDQHASSQRPVDWWWLAYQSDLSGNWEIYRRRGSDNSSTQLTFHPAADTDPALNPGATAIVFVSERDGNAEIYRMGADGSGQTRLTHHAAADTQPTWSADGVEITFVSTRDGNAELYRMRADGSARQRLTTDGAADRFPNWSRDGQQLVWVKEIGNQGWLWVMERDGSNARAIAGPLRRLQHPVWSPDRTQIVFDYDVDGDDYNELGLFTVADGTVALFEDVNNVPPFPLFELEMGDWSPHGKGITLVSSEYKWQQTADGYEIVQQRIGLDRLCLVGHCDGGLLTVGPEHPGAVLAPSIQSEDIWAPQTILHALPRVQRRGNFLVRWSGRDQGPAGIASYDLQYRTERVSVWHDWLVQASDTSAIFHLFDPGIVESVETIYFRSRATDQAGNQGNWIASPSGETATTFFATTLVGQVTDARGIPRVGQELTVLPALSGTTATDNQGNFELRLPTTGRYQVNNVSLDATVDQAYTFYELPSENLLENGGFEAASRWQGWQRQGTYSPTMSTDFVQRGSGAARLGYDCVPNCLTKVSAPPSLDNDEFTFIPSNSDVVHALARSPAGQLLYLQYTDGGGWSTPRSLARGAIFNLRGVEDATGALHIFWELGTDVSQIAYATRTAEGVWKPALQLNAGQQPEVVLGLAGELHLFYNHCADHCVQLQLYHRQRTAAGDWLPEEMITSNLSNEVYRAAVTSDHQIHLAWLEREQIDSATSTSQLRYATFSNETTVSTSQVLVEKPYLGQIELMAAGDDQLYLLYEHQFLLTKPLTGTWSAPMLIANNRGLLAVDQAGSAHLFTSSVDGQSWYHRFASTDDSAWSTPHTEPHSFPQVNSVDIIAPERFQWYSAQGDFWRTTDVSTTGQSSLAQSVTIPANLHKPTLSWMQEIQGGSGGQSHFQLSIQDEITTTVLYSRSSNIPWQLAWVDLAPWAGQRVTVTFTVEQAAGEPPFLTYLDQIALGAWQTPLPLRVTPRSVDIGVAATVVITGENFIATPQVRVGNTAIANVTWQDEGRLEVSLPASLAAGIYPITLINPAGEMATLPNAIAIGEQSYLPIILQQ